HRLGMLDEADECRGAHPCADSSAPRAAAVTNSSPRGVIRQFCLGKARHGPCEPPASPGAVSDRAFGDLQFCRLWVMFRRFRRIGRMSARGAPHGRDVGERGLVIAATPRGPPRARGGRTMNRSRGLAALACVLTLSFADARAEETIKVGILHSLSGTMAISETSLKDVALMTIEEINARGGVLGKKIEPVVVDPASNWPLFAEKARQLLTKDKVAAVFGCWTSVSRKSVLPVFEELNGLL